MTDISALEAKEQFKDSLLEIEGVVGVGVGSGSGPVLNIYVKKMTTEIQEKLPSVANGMPTRIIEVGEIRALPITAQMESLQSLDVSRTVKMRPCPMGVSIGNVGVSAGTAGCVVKDLATGQYGILSNAHVLVDYPPATYMDDPTVVQPGVYDGGGPNDILGQTTRWIPLKTTAEPGAINYVDCALCLPDSQTDISPNILDLGTPAGIDTARQGMHVIKSGRSSGVTEAEVLDVSADIRVGYGDFSCQFTDQIITTPFGIPGDSGSAVINKANNRVCGLLFAGSDSITVVNKIHNVLGFLSLTLGGQGGTKPIGTWTTWTSAVGLLLLGGLGYTLLGGLG